MRRPSNSAVCCPRTTLSSTCTRTSTWMTRASTTNSTKSTLAGIATRRPRRIRRPSPRATQAGRSKRRVARTKMNHSTLAIRSRKSVSLYRRCIIAVVGVPVAVVGVEVRGGGKWEDVFFLGMLIMIGGEKAYSVRVTGVPLELLTHRRTISSVPKSMAVTRETGPHRSASQLLQTLVCLCRDALETSLWEITRQEEVR